MADASFQSLLSAPVSEVDRPKPMPVGSFVWNVAKFEFGESKQKKTNFVKFTLTPVQALDDVDQADLAAALGEKTLSDKSMTTDFYLTPDAIWRLDEFLLEKVMCEPGQSRTEMISDAVGKQVIAQVVHQPSQRDENVVYANLSNYAPYEG